LGRRWWWVAELHRGSSSAAEEETPAWRSGRESEVDAGEGKGDRRLVERISLPRLEAQLENQKHSRHRFMHMIKPGHAIQSPENMDVILPVLDIDVI
jgi:hypothetical protein